MPYPPNYTLGLPDRTNSGSLFGRGPRPNCRLGRVQLPHRAGLRPSRFSRRLPMSSAIQPQPVTMVGVRVLLATIAIAVWSPASRSQVISDWTGVSGNWTNPALWSTNPNYPNNGNPPGATYAVRFVTQGGTLNVDTPITVQSLQHLLGATSLTGTQLTVLGQTQVETSSMNFAV